MHVLVSVLAWEGNGHTLKMFLRWLILFLIWHSNLRSQLKITLRFFTCRQGFHNYFLSLCVNIHNEKLQFFCFFFPDWAVENSLPFITWCVKNAAKKGIYWPWVIRRRNNVKPCVISIATKVRLLKMFPSGSMWRLSMT